MSNKLERQSEGGVIKHQPLQGFRWNTSLGIVVLWPGSEGYVWSVFESIRRQKALTKTEVAYLMLAGELG